MGGLINHEVIMDKANKKTNSSTSNCTSTLQSTARVFTILDRGAQIQGARSPRPVNFVRWRLISVGPQNGAFFIPKIRMWLFDFSENLCTANLTSLVKRNSA